MCKAFSCIIKESGEVLWKLGLDSHSDILREFGIRDNENREEYLTFAKIEITPQNNDYLNPDKWVFRVDEKVTPTWFTKGYEQFCWEAHAKWLTALDKILDRTPVVNPFTVVPPKKITNKHLKLLKTWASVWASVGASVRDSVWDSVEDSVGDSAEDSVRDSVGASVGSKFKLPRKDWKYTENIKTKGYPFQSCVDLWNLGLVVSFDGTNYRLHGGTKAEVLWIGTVEDLKKV